ncbi:MAG: hypothetical protein A2V85_13380 [Chloroflexi bacterium RBG_16_72_14]|nr:MAG: hypothetical protein A2V85_13380 [Chloroflexi bacterium RBG_16_72_14]
MTTSLLGDAFAHHVWATDRLIDACAALTPEQRSRPEPGTYGSILGTLRHLVASDRWYLSFFHDGLAEIDEQAETSLAELRTAITDSGAAWTELLAGQPDPDADVVELDGSWEVHSPTSLRLAQVIHHGTDHRSQVCTALTSLGVEPPEIDVWAYARETGGERGVRVGAP